MSEQIYNVVAEQFAQSLQRERKTIYDYWTGEPRECFFRRNKDTNQTNNNVSIYYLKDELIYEGELISFRNKVFLVLNRETDENDVYRRSDMLETNMIIETYSEQKELRLPCYAYDLLNPNPDTGSMVDVINGNIELISEQCPLADSIEVNSKFVALGGNYEVVNKYNKSGIVHIFIKRESASAAPTAYSLAINANAEYGMGDTATLTALATCSEGPITNATIEWDSGDPNIATITQDGAVAFIAAGNVTISARWVEHDVTATTNISVVAETPLHCEITGTAYVRVGGAAKSLTAVFYDAVGNVDNTVSPVWSLGLTPSQAGKIHIVSIDGLKASVAVDENADDLIDSTFIIILTDTTGEYNTSLTLEIRSMF